MEYVALPVLVVLVVVVVVVVVVWELEVASAEEAEGAAGLAGGPNGRGESKGDGGPGDHGLHISIAQLILVVTERLWFVEPPVPSADLQLASTCVSSKTPSPLVVVVVVVVDVDVLVLLDPEVIAEELQGNQLYLSVAVDLEPVGADQVLLVEHGVVRAQEVEILKLIV